MIDLVSPSEDGSEYTRARARGPRSARVCAHSFVSPGICSVFFLFFFGINFYRTTATHGAHVHDVYARPNRYGREVRVLGIIIYCYIRQRVALYVDTRADRTRRRRRYPKKCLLKCVSRNRRRRRRRWWRRRRRRRRSSSSG